MRQKTKIWTILVLVELSYISISTYLTLAWGWDSFYGELIKDLARVASLTIDVLLYRKFLRPDPVPKAEFRATDPRLLVLAVLVIALPALTSLRPQQDLPWLLVFSLGSFAVGFREEFFYRVLVQSALVKRFSPVVGILIATALFAVYHLSYFLMGTWIAVGEVILFSLAAGILYHVTRSFLLVALIHSSYDAMFMVNPMPGQVFSEEFLLYFLAVIAIVAATLFWKGLRSPVGIRESD